MKPGNGTVLLGAALCRYAQGRGKAPSGGRRGNASARAEEASGWKASQWDQIEMDVNRQPENQVYEFENLESCLFDERYQNHSDNAAMDLVSRKFKVPESHITDIRCLKAGMTNKSFLFRVDGAHCICRIPGPGTELFNQPQGGKRGL